MHRRALASVFLGLALLVAPGSAFADAGADAGADGASDASSDGATDATVVDAAMDAPVDAPITSDGGPITFRPDADPVEDSGTPINPPADAGGCNASGGAAGLLTAGWPLVLALAALARRRRRA